MDAEFEYCRIGERLLERMATLLADGISPVLLGLRQVGKSYLLRHLAAKLRGEGRCVIELDFLNDPQSTGSQTLQIQTNPFPEAEAGASRAPRHHVATAMTGGGASPTPVLLLANVDSLAEHDAQKYLRQLKNLTLHDGTVAVLSGEEGLAALTHGREPEFRGTHYFIVQGFERAEFGVWLQRRLALVQLVIEDQERVIDTLFELTGGNIYVSRAILGLLAETRARLRRPDPRQPIVAEELTGVVQNLAELTSMGVSVYDRSVEIIDRNPACWAELQMLLEQPCTTTHLPDPHPLVLAGVCVRETRAEPLVCLASALAARFLKAHYTARRWGDLYASRGDWEQAFAFYEKIPAGLRLRPASVNDRVQVKATLKAAIAELHREATEADGKQKLSSLRHFLTWFCRKAFGSAKVSFFRCTGGWVPSRGSHLNEDEARETRRLLESFRLQLESGSGSDIEVTPTAAIAMLPGLRESQVEAVVIHDASADDSSRERRELLRELLIHFRQAYIHATEVLRHEEVSRARAEHREITQTILQSLGATIRNPRQVIEEAARKLRIFEYKRTLFCLVDSTRQFIKGVVNCSDEPHVNLAQMTNYLLAEPTRDIQPYVVETKKTFVVREAQREPLVNKDAARQAGLRAFAIVPILTPVEVCIGTIHIERSDGDIPSEKEISNFEDFGRNLAIILELSERVSLLQTTLDEIKDPVLLLGQDSRLCYANGSAGELFDIEVGWRSRAADRPDPFATANGLASRRVQELLKLVEKVSVVGHSLQEHVKGIRDGRIDHVLAQPIKDESGRPVGFALHLRELSQLYRLLQAFETFAESENPAESLHRLLDMVKILGSSWARLYLVNPDDPNELLSERSLNFRGAQSFDRGEIRLRAREVPVDETFYSLDQGTPVIFRWMPEEKEGERDDAERSMSVVYVQDPQQSEYFDRRPGDYWLDLPIIITNHKGESVKIGKLTVECPADGA